MPDVTWLTMITIHAGVYSEAKVLACAVRKAVAKSYRPRSEACHAVLSKTTTGNQGIYSVLHLCSPSSSHLQGRCRNALMWPMQL